MKPGRPVVAAIAICIPLLLAATACSASEPAGSVTTAAASVIASGTLGPYPARTPVTASGIRLELTGVEVADTDWGRLSERTPRSNGATGTRAAAGSRYVDVTLDVLQSVIFSVNARPIDLNSYVLADGKRFESVDSTRSKVARGMPRIAYATTQEYEIPATARSAVLFVQPRWNDSRPVSFRLW